MMKKVLFVLTLGMAALFAFNTVSAQFSQAELNFLNTQFKVERIGDAVVGVRADGMSNTFGLPSVKDFLKKFKSNNNKSTNDIQVTLVDIGARTLYDLCSNGSPVQIWQDPTNANFVHAAFVYSPMGDPQPSFPGRRSKYYYSTDKGATWTFITDVPSVRSGFPAIDGFGDGSALVVNHSNVGKAYKDLGSGLGGFTELDAPGNRGYIWPRVVSTSSLSLTNKFVFLGSISGFDTTRWNTCTDVNSTPGSWIGWTTIPSDAAETYSIARGEDGRIGMAFKNNDSIQPNDYGDVWFIESTNNGTSFSAPLKIFDANFSTDSLGLIRGISIVYKGNAPAVAFETVKQTQAGTFFPGAPAAIRFWSNTLPGSDPNRSVIVADTNRVGWHPYVGVNDVLSSLGRPNIGVSADGNALFVAFMVPSDLGGGVDTTVFSDIWLSASQDGGLTWPVLGKLNPANPVKDWRYVSVSKWNDNVGTDYYVNMVTLRGHVPASYVNGVTTGMPESNEEYWSIRAKVTFGSISISDPTGAVPTNYALSQNYPNPFNPTTTIKFQIPQAGLVKLAVYDLLGREVGLLVNTQLAAGSYSYVFDASKLTSGVYLYKLESGNFSEVKKMFLVK